MLESVAQIHGYSQKDELRLVWRASQQMEPKCCLGSTSLHRRPAQHLLSMAVSATTFKLLWKHINEELKKNTREGLNQLLIPVMTSLHCFNAIASHGHINASHAT